MVAQAQGFVTDGQEGLGGPVRAQGGRDGAGDVVHIAVVVILHEQAQQGHGGVGLAADEDGLAAQLFHRAAGHEQHAHDIAVGADGKILHQMVALGAHCVFETGIGGDVQLAPGHHVVEDGGRPGDDLEIVGDDARFQGMIDGQDVEVADTAHAQGISGQTGFTGHGIPPGRRAAVSWWAVRGQREGKHPCGRIPECCITGRRQKGKGGSRRFDVPRPSCI